MGNKTVTSKRLFKQLQKALDLPDDCKRVEIIIEVDCLVVIRTTYIREDESDEFTDVFSEYNLVPKGLGGD